jgi:hypothetical protein
MSHIFELQVELQKNIGCFFVSTSLELNTVMPSTSFIVSSDTTGLTNFFLTTLKFG